jgi:hypothetical protein
LWLKSTGSVEHDVPPGVVGTLGSSAGRARDS